MRRFAILSTVFLSLSCSNKLPLKSVYEKLPLISDNPDYSNLEYWAAHPFKKDPSDSIPSELHDTVKDTIADVFFIHPTTYTGLKKGWNASLSDNELNSKTDYTTILYQASAFNQHCRIFAPRYRQAHISAFFTSSKESEEAFDTAYEDLKNAFEYYMHYWNNGRGFIIVGHSQGAKLSERLIKEFIDGKPLQKKLIAAYILGWPVPKNFFNQLQVCSSPAQTGCFCTWRTFQKGYEPTYIQHESPVSYVTNPLSWTTDSTYSNKNENIGSVLRNFNKIIPNTTDAQIHDGVLWVSKPRFPGSILFFSKNYHIGDINLFYLNIRENVEERIRNFKPMD
jgi:hypothetical protein